MSQMGNVNIFTLKFISYRYIVYDCSATIWLHLLHFGTTTERVSGNTEDSTAVIEHWSAGCRTGCQLQGVEIPTQCRQLSISTSRAGETQKTALQSRNTGVLAMGYGYTRQSGAASLEGSKQPPILTKKR